MTKEERAENGLLRFPKQKKFPWQVRLTCARECPRKCWWFFYYSWLEKELCSV